METGVDNVLEAGSGSDGCLLNRRYRSAPVTRYTNMENETPIEVQLAASQLGKRGRGRPKTITPEDRQRRVDQMETINEKRRTIRVQGIVVNSPGGNTTVQQRVKAPQIQQVTNPALIDQIEQESKKPTPWAGERTVRVQGKVVS